MKIFLDDRRTEEYIKRHHTLSQIEGLVIVKTYDEFVSVVNEHLKEITFVSFDHDLACFDKYAKEWTGKDACMYLVDMCIENQINFPDWYVHTDNVNGGPNIIYYILNYLRNIENKDVDMKYYHKGFINGKVVK